MANNKKAASKEAAKPKKVFVTVNEKKYELLGGPNKKYIFKGETFTKETAAKNAELLKALAATGSPLLEEVS